jgi:hypothetical protein
MVQETTCNRLSSGRSSLTIKAVHRLADGMLPLPAEALTIKTSRLVCHRSSLRCRGEALISRISSPICLRYSLPCQDSRGSHRCSRLNNSSRQSCNQLAVFIVRAIATSLDTMLPLTTDQCHLALFAVSGAVSNMTLRLLKTISARRHGAEGRNSSHRNLDATSRGAL